MKCKSVRLHPILVLIFAFSLAAPVLAQNITGTIVGTVRDSSGGVMPGSAVSLTNEETNIQFAVIADETGDFVVPNLAPGIYTVKTEATGFKQNIVKGVRLLANRTVRVDVVLEPGAHCSRGPGAGDGSGRELRNRDHRQRHGEPDHNHASAQRTHARPAHTDLGRSDQRQRFEPESSGKLVLGWNSLQRRRREL